jgi:hypothetical protein
MTGGRTVLPLLDVSDSVDVVDDAAASCCTYACMTSMSILYAAAVSTVVDGGEEKNAKFFVVVVDEDNRLHASLVVGTRANLVLIRYVRVENGVDNMRKMISHIVYSL